MYSVGALNKWGGAEFQNNDYLKSLAKLLELIMENRMIIALITKEAGELEKKGEEKVRNTEYIDRGKRFLNLSKLNLSLKEELSRM